MKKPKQKIQNLFISLIFISIFSFVALSPVQTQAAGLVPCGGTGESACNFCHFFVLLNNIINFVFRLVPVVAALMLFFAGVKMFMAVENPGEVKNAQEIIRSVIIGLIIIYAAWALVGAFLATIGLATWTENIFKTWWTNGLFQFNCPT